MDEDKKQYWLMSKNARKYNSTSRGIFTHLSIMFDSLSDLIAWASKNHINLETTKIVIGKESRLKLELV